MIKKVCDMVKSANKIIQLHKCSSCKNLSHVIREIEKERFCLKCFDKFLENVPPIEYYLLLEKMQHDIND